MVTLNPEGNYESRSFCGYKMVGHIINHRGEQLPGQAPEATELIKITDIP